MDGKHKAVIQSWFDTVIQEGERGRAHELHVDQIDKSWELESSWISAALESFNIANRIRDDYRSDSQWTVVLAFFLASDFLPIGITFHNQVEMEEAFSGIPPALFLWPAGDEFWVRVERSEVKREDSKIKVLNAEDFFGDKYKMFKCIFLEHIWSGREDYLRAVYLAR